MKPNRYIKYLNKTAWFVLFSTANYASAQTSTIIATVPSAVSGRRAALVGPVEQALTLSLSLHLPLRNQAELNKLLKQLYDPNSPRYHRYVSVEEFTSQFCASQSDYDAMVRWAGSKGLTVTSTTPNRRLINVSGSAAIVNSAFNIRMNRYRDPSTGRIFYSPDLEPELNSPVQLLAITGLSDINPKMSHSRYSNNPGWYLHRGESKSQADVVGSGPSNTYLPSDIRAAYYGSGPLTGAGQTIGIFSFDGYLTSDLQLYYDLTLMLSTVPVINQLVDGFTGACTGPSGTGTCEDGEQILDIVNAIGMAPGIAEILFYEGQSAASILNQMASDNTAKVLSSSWSGGDFGPADDPIFEEFQAQGQTYVNASGDYGEFNPLTYYPPCVDPNITQVGGTDLVTNGKAGPWLSETGWDHSGGGYVSGTEIPEYQLLAGVITVANQGSTSLRNAPDVAAEANSDNFTVSNGAPIYNDGGTSYATPRWAGLIALANQQSALNGNGTVGFLNPAIYNIGVSSAFASSFHDITSGINASTFGIGGGFTAIAGYDLVTGWGSPNGPALINALAGPTVPMINSISPGTVYVNQNTTLSVSGWNFLPGFTASVTTPLGTFPLTGAALTFIDSQDLQVQVDMGGTNGYTTTLTISNPGGQSASGTFQVIGGVPISGTLTGSTTWNQLGIPYIIGNNGLTIPAGATLTIAPGVVVKFMTTATAISYLDVQGTLVANGTATQGIVFTSYLDDAADGDTNGDGGATVPNPGDWTAIRFDSGAKGSLSYATVRYGGYSANIHGTISLAALDVGSGSSTPTLSNCQITNNLTGMAGGWNGNQRHH